MNTTTLIANARLRELIRMVLRWYLFVNDKPHSEFHDSLVRLFVFPVTNKHIHLEPKQAFYLRGALKQYKNALMRSCSNIELGKHGQFFAAIHYYFTARRFTLICIQDLLRQLENIQKD